MNRMFFFPRRIAFLSALVCTCCIGFAEAQAVATHSPRVEGIRFWSFGDVTRIAIETTGEYKLYSETIEKPDRVFFDLIGLAPPSAANRGMETITVGDHRIKQIRVAGLSDSKTRIVFDLDSSVDVLSSQLVNPDRLMIEIRPKGASLPALAAHSVVGSRKLDLASVTTSAVDKDITETEMPASKAITKPPVVEAGKDAVSKDVSKGIKGPNKDDDPDEAFHPKSSTPVTESTTAIHASLIPKTSVPSPSVPTTTIALPTPTIAPPAAVLPTPTASLTPPASQTVEPNKSSPNGTALNKTATSPSGITTAKNDSSGDRSLIRILGLKLGRVVIDAGHGGHDSGTVGPNGLMEKELVLDVALRLGAMISKQMGAEVVYTRSTDVFIPLEQRTRIANDQKADLFISVHANSSSEPSATGVETYYFNLTSDKTGLDLATRENASADSSISDLNDLLHRAVLQTKREESREFAQKIQTSMCAMDQKTNTKPVDRGVRQAPFVVLIGATMPSILAEIGFVSNPHDEKLLRKTDQRQKIADALFKGVVQYANSLSHVQIARASAE